MRRHKGNGGDGGQSVLEYVILASLIGIFCMIAVKQFGDSLRTRINHMRREVVRAIPTG